MKSKAHRFWPKGYTLMELVIVLVVIALLAAVAVPTIGNMVTESQVRVTEKEMVELVKAIIGDPEQGLRGYVDELGALPATVNALHSIGASSPYNPFTRTGWNGPYIDTTRKDVDNDGVVGANEFDSLNDSWGNPYVYNQAAGTLTSWGPDEAAAGGDDIVVTIDS